MSEQFFEGTDQVTSDNQATADNASAKPETTQSKMYGPGKKYKTVEDLDAAAFHQEEHIRKLEAENAELRARDVKSRTLDEALQLIKTKDTNSDTTQTSAASTESTVNKSEDLAKIAEEIYEKKREKERRDSNRLSVANQIMKTFGDRTKAQDYLNKRSEELGLSTKRILEIAEESPHAALEILLPTAEKPTFAFNKSSQAPGIGQADNTPKRANFSEDPRVLDFSNDAKYKELMKEAMKTRDWDSLYAYMAAQNKKAGIDPFAVV
jgi:hypothetical protein